MSQIRRKSGFSPEDIYRKIERECGKNYRVINKDTKMRFSFPFFLKKEFTFDYEVIKEEKKDKKSIIEKLKQTQNEKEIEINNEVATTYVQQPFNTKMQSSEYTQIFDYLKEQEMDQKWIEYLLSEAQKDNPNTFYDWQDSINKIIEEEIVDWVENKNFKIFTLFGPTGVGKTTTLIKIMNRLQSGNKKIGVITTDNFRVGAYEQMKNYSEKLGFPLIQSKVEELSIPVNVFKNQKGMDYILIDTYGRNSKDIGMKEELELYLKTVEPENISLVLAANQKSKDMIKTIRSYRDFNINHIIITKMDETDSYGFIYNIYKEFGIPVSYITNGQSVPNDIEIFTKKYFTTKLWENFSF